MKRQYNWLAPQQGATAYEPKEADRRSFATLAEFREATGQEAHGLEIDYDIFENLSPPDPARRYHVYHSADLSFRLKAGGNAIDAGVPLPTVNDGFTGKAPDLGALEFSGTEPHYGPRWLTWKPFYR